MARLPCEVILSDTVCLWEVLKETQREKTHFRWGSWKWKGHKKNAEPAFANLSQVPLVGILHFAGEMQAPNKPGEGWGLKTRRRPPKRGSQARTQHWPFCIPFQRLVGEFPMKLEALVQLARDSLERGRPGAIVCLGGSPQNIRATSGRMSRACVS